MKEESCRRKDADADVVDWYHLHNITTDSILEGSHNLQNPASLIPMPIISLIA